MALRRLANTQMKMEDDNRGDCLIHPFDEISNSDGLTYAQAQADHLAIIQAINAEISRTSPGGELIAVPLCPSACRPGPLCDFLLMLQCDPFSRLNMVYFASDDATATALDTLVWSAEMENTYDKELVAFYKRAMQGWQDFKRLSPDATRIDVLNHRDMYRHMICEVALKIEGQIFSTRRNLWRKHFGEKIKVAA